MQQAKSELLKVCSECPRKYQKGCIIADIEGNKANYINPPPCMNLAGYEKSLAGYEKSLAGYEAQNTKNGNNNTETPPAKIPHKKDPYLRQVQYRIGTTKITGLDVLIGKYIDEQCHENLIVKKLSLSRSWIQYRIKHLEKAGLIRSWIQKTAIGTTKIFQKTDAWTKSVRHNERSSSTHDKTPAVPFTAHHMTWKFPILSGPQPKSNHPFKMNNWVGYIFDRDPPYLVRTTPRNIIIEVHIDLGADSIDNLNNKYRGYAETSAYRFSQEHNLKLGQGEKYRNPHYTLKNTALGKLLTERGELYSKDLSLQIDKSKSPGDAEFTDEQEARGFEYTVARMPRIVNGLQLDLKNVNSSIQSLEDSLELSERLHRVEARVLEPEVQEDTPHSVPSPDDKKALNLMGYA